MSLQKLQLVCMIIKLQEMNTEELGGERRGCREGEKQQSEVNVVVGGGWVV